MRSAVLALAVIGPLVGGAGQAWAAEAAAIPEPGSLSLLILAATGLILGRRFARR